MLPFPAVQETASSSGTPHLVFCCSTPKSAHRNPACMHFPGMRSPASRTKEMKLDDPGAGDCLLRDVG